MGHAGRDNFVCLKCGYWYGHKGKCDSCGGLLKADRLLTEEESERLLELAEAGDSVINSVTM
jgi:hypothetical protein